MIFVQYLLTFCLTVARPELGLIILTFALASVGTIWSPTSIAGLGSLQLSDFALLGIASNLICHPRSWNKNRYFLWIVILLWTLVAGLVFATTQTDGFKIAYNIIIRYGLLWLIPISVAELSSAKRQTVLAGMLACGVFVTGVQAYSYIKRDPSFTVKMYYQFSNSPANTTPEEYAQQKFNDKGLPRLYPSGALLLESLLVFVLVSHMLSDRVGPSAWLMAALCCLYGVFFVSLRGRSSAISLAIVMCLFLGSRLIHNCGFRPAVRGCGIALIGILAVLAYQAETGASFVHDFGNRFQNEDLLQQDNRVHDIYLALKAISTSPLFGTASANVADLALAERSKSPGLDVNPFLSVAVLGGLPLLGLVLAAAWQCGKRCRRLMIWPPCNNQLIAAAMSVLYMFCQAALNTNQVFTQPNDMVPLLIFVGFVESPILARLKTVRAPTLCSTTA